MKFPTFKSSIAYTEYAFIVQRKATEMEAMTEHPLVASHYAEGVGTWKQRASTNNCIL
jgi:hypothetical protein